MRAIFELIVDFDGILYGDDDTQGDLDFILLNRLSFNHSKMADV
jgi:hypothetical protein